MCTTCGCGDGETRIEGDDLHDHDHTHADGSTHRHPHDHAHDHGHAHGHSHAYVPAHSHAPGVAKSRMVQIEQDILAKNDAYAAKNRALFAARGIFALNLVSSPGSGKTTLLVKTIEALRGQAKVAVIEGDQQTSQDAERIRASGAPAIQINTGKGCHLDAHMVGHALEKLQPAEDSLLMIENVGNLVCPAAFDLGEAHKVVILSVTEGEDKPIKYPDMFRAAKLMLLNKCDLLPHLAYSVAGAIEFARRVNPGIEVIRISATSGEGMAEWLAWIERGAAVARRQRAEAVAAL
ncbi:MAG: hydrogenase accessory protein HypB [Rhodocyclales bacterium GWA2_65_20]|nr:MAG: hydrogenase accessory protein HypB [Rhodocyclales bacterium GWA2_65_20]